MVFRVEKSLRKEWRGKRIESNGMCGESEAAAALAQSGIPVMFDHVNTNNRRFNHIPGGANVLFFDGHCEYFRYPSFFPVTRAFAVATTVY